eukprot:CAMPEP_0194062190 /NCGR_PEP_ID=MMETSP0009_2-20130614/76773_1 /TAXON_ID=210454 /ORGANISM="Grammatophora oceanica, Strain CCMP 410" /LENGTH=140 /DNA_ID=CAMNT_0038713835 /DNA_START=86 /DNA_END=509 /DNA_ORIENTATION=+
MRRRKLSPILMYASMNGSHDDASFWLENVNGSHDDASFRLEEQDHKRWNPTKDETDSTALGSIINKTTKTALLEPLASLIYLGARCFGPFVTIREILPSDELFYHGIVTASPTDGSNNGAILSLEEKGMEDEQGQRRGLV